MALRIDYNGNVGNCMFQYVFARLLAEKNNLELITPFPYQKLLKTTLSKRGRRFSSPVEIWEEPGFAKTLIQKTPVRPDGELAEEMKKFYDSFSFPLMPGMHILRGYFEYSELFNYDVEIIKSFFHLSQPSLNNKDIVMNIRLGDFDNGKFIISPQWYLKILEQEAFEQLYIVGADKDEIYLNAFQKYKPIIIPTHPATDFHFIRNFSKIICSNSTYCWWAAFLSEASAIYISDKWISPLLTSCKNSVSVTAEYLTSYKPTTIYKGMNTLMSVPEQLEISLTKFATFDSQTTIQLIEGFTMLLYSFIKENNSRQAFSMRISIANRFLKHFVFEEDENCQGENKITEPNVSIVFFDWRACIQFFIFQDDILPYIGKSTYINVENGDVSILFSKIALSQDQRLILNNYSYKNILQAKYLEYVKSADVPHKILDFMERGCFVWVINMDQYNFPLKNISILFNEKKIVHETKLTLTERLKIQKIQEYVSGEKLRENSGDISLLNLISQQRKPAEIVEALTSFFFVESFDRVLRIFNSSPIDYLVINEYIIKNNYLDE